MVLKDVIASTLLMMLLSAFQNSGTSFATPVVTGVIALLLEINPDLGWRDVQAILALTARQTDPDDESWVTNGAGLHHSNKYGFGIINANSAVTMAENWVSYSPEVELTVQSGGIYLVIPDDPDQTVNSTLSIGEEQAGFAVESVVVFIGYQHVKRGNLKIVLTSPSGTASALHPSKRGEDTNLPEGTKWELMTVSNWGESPVGDWTLSITDERLDADSLSFNYLKTWDISIYGRYTGPSRPSISPTSTGEKTGSPSASPTSEARSMLRMEPILTMAGLAAVALLF
jgi:subtilisin-like proprotein convertase family protein